MTTIIAVEKNGSVEIGWDSQVTTGSRRGDCVKAFVNDRVVFLGAGSVRTVQVIEFMELPSMPTYDPDWDSDKWVTTKLLPAIGRRLKEEDAALLENSQVDTESNLLIVVEGRVYDVSSNFAWTRNSDGIYSLGSGSSYALGALFAGAKIDKALEAAVRYDIYTGGPLTVTTDKKLLDAK